MGAQAPDAPAVRVRVMLSGEETARSLGLSTYVALAEVGLTMVPVPPVHNNPPGTNEDVPPNTLDPSATHTDKSGPAENMALGFTLTVIVKGLPAHPPAWPIGVTV